MNEVVFRPDPNRNHPPIDENVRLPRQVLLAVERAEALIAGRQTRPVEVNAASAKSGSASKFPTDAQMDAALAWLEANADPSDPDSTIALEIFREGERIIEARRRGAQKPRKASDAVTQRMEALLQAFRELPLKLNYIKSANVSKMKVERQEEQVWPHKSSQIYAETNVLQ